MIKSEQSDADPVLLAQACVCSCITTDASRKPEASRDDRSLQIAIQQRD
jgi:hypothetical protein